MGASAATVSCILLVVMLLGSPAASAPWVELRISPDPVRVLDDAGGGDAQITVEIENRVRVPLRVEDVRFVYFRDDQSLATRRPPAGFFESSRFSRERRIDRGERITWQAVCLSDVPLEADRVRLEMVLSARRRFEEGRSRATASADLLPAAEPLEMILPFRGYWRVTQGNGCGTNHRIGGRGGEFAWDFAAVDRSGSVMPERAKRNEESPTFGRAVISPVQGRVARVVDGYEDNDELDGFPRRSLLDDLRRPDWVYGNYVVLQAGSSEFVLLAHLEHGSIAVSEGASVERGDLVARSGNSGNSMRPHLHIHAMDRSDPADADTQGIPIRFVRFVEIRGAGTGEEREIQVRKVSSGKPKETSVVAPDLDAP